MRSSTSRYDDRRRIARWTILPALVAIVVAVALPARASAAPCPVNPGNSTAWIGDSGNFGDSANWSNGTPTASCDVSITKTGSYTVTMTSGANTKSFTLGGPGSTPNLVISVQNPNTNLDAQPAGITIAEGASVVLTCPPSPGECVGGSGSGAHIYSGSSPFLNAGTITVDPNSGSGAEVGGVITNTGTIAFENSGGAPYSASLGGKVTNQGVITIGNGGNVVNQGSSCGGTEPFVKNDTGGSVSGTGTGVLSVINFEQGNGTTEDVVIPCGSLKYTGTGASEVRAFGGFDLSGEIHANQSLTVSAARPNTNARLVSDVTSKGPIVFTCPEGGCNGGSGSGVGLNANGHSFTNAGSLTVDPASGTGAYIDSNGGSVTNTGTIKFEKSAGLLGLMTNQGKISLANSASVNGGQIEQTGAGAEIVIPTGTNLGPGAPLKLKAGTLRGGGSVSGTVENTGGVVAPGASPGTLTVTGSYVQAAGGRLEIEVAGTGAGQFDTLAVGGGATLGGTLALIPTAGFAENSAVGNSVPFLTYGSSVAGGFSPITVNPALSCGKAFATSTDEGAKALKATVVAGGTACPSGGTGSSGGAAPPPISPPSPTPKKTCPKGKQLKQGKCVVKKCPKGKKLKRGRCVKKKQPKAKASHRRF
ncbi:MAG TPA: hypothetical protein VLK37_01080 [Solirubrobacterales bacterium]|nr:hypothetical protein [Solirubrobacterales bacterium]